jgi:lipoprotein-releasing system permease protein
MKYKLIKLQGGTFLIDYFPVKIVGIDIIMVVITSIVITLIASWIPSIKGSKESLQLR